MTEYETITVQPLTAAIGATIDGVDATQPLPRGQAAEIRRALLDHLVIFLRGQDLTEDQHVAFAANFGPLNPGSIDPRDGNVGSARHSARRSCRQSEVSPASLETGKFDIVRRRP